MYFSEHNDNITFNNRSCGYLDVEGKGTLRAEDLDARPGYFKPEEYTKLNITKGITKVTKGFIEAFTSMESLELAFSVKSLERTPELDNYLITNNVLIRGEYNSLAERLARELGLRFLHSDIFLGWRHSGFDGYYENKKLTLRFRTDGPPYLYKEVFTPGISAGNCGGGEFSEDLPEDFYVGCDLDGFTYLVPAVYEEMIMRNKQLERFLRISNQRLKKKPGAK